MQRKNNPELQAVVAQLCPDSRPASVTYEPVSGLTGESWRFDTGRLQGLAREASQAKSLLGASRRQEYRILRRLRHCHLAPSAWALTPGWLLVEWIKGRAFSTDEWQNTLADGGLARCLSGLHKMPLLGYPLALPQRLLRWWHYVDPSRRTPAWLKLHKRFTRSTLPRPLLVAPLHMDIHAGNLIIGSYPAQPMHFIDWEYAGDGDIALELAALFRGNDVSRPQQMQFIDDYCQASGLHYTAPQLLRQIARWLPWVDYLMLMWYEVRWQQTGEKAFTELADCLGARMGLRR
ncbi:thiamine kinase [Biostraticola tofi]|uniref:Thiamine kinase n=1 Tax=Biostraticola tofi TaxID=466109 RepID=A0A4R3Z098_9GAMM|nr:thiamine kinase [Biostraticola tofi]